MKKSALLWTAIVVLFLLNTGTIFFILTRPQPGNLPRDQEAPGGAGRFDDHVIATLQLTPEQVAGFERMKRDHHEHMLQLDESTRAPFEQYFGLLAGEESNPALKDSLERIVARQYITRMQITYNHFNDLKAICTPEQKKKFARLVPSLMQVMASGKKNMDPPRRKR